MATDTLRGIVYMMLGVASLAAMDAAGKWIVREHSVFQLLALRSSLALVLLLLLTPLLGGREAFRTSQPLAHGARAVAGLLAFVFFFTSVRYLPLAEAVAIAFGGPFIVTALSVPILGEAVDAKRWLAVGVGFFGMLLIVQPTRAAFHPASLLVIVASVAYALMMVLTRWMARRSSGSERTTTFLVYTFLVQSLAGFVIGLPYWKTMTPLELLLSGAVGVLALVGHFGITAAFQRAPASVVAPFEYTALVWATFFGWFVFGDFPGAVMWLGVSVIAGAGLYTVHRESRAT